MTIYLAGDHAGLRLKETLRAHLPMLGHEVVDLGPETLNPADDYPDYVTPLAQKIADEPGAVGIILAGSGEGEAMCANRILGVRAAVFYGKEQALESLDVEGGTSQDGFDVVRLSRKHNNANVLSIGARFVSAEDADEAVRIFLTTPFSGDERHSRRLGKF